MIYTVTLNPSIDLVMDVDKLSQGQVNRSKCEHYDIGGKGINVSVVLNNLGIPSVALGFCAGYTGTEIIKIIESEGIKNDFIKLKKGVSRINVKLKSESITEINGNGPEINNKDIDTLLSKLSLLNKGDTLVLAGSIPKSIPDNIYETIISKVNDKNIKVVVDATGDLLCNVLKCHPFLIKPNHIELGEIFNTTIKNTDDVILYANKLKEKGAINVLVSMAEKGAVLVDENNKVHICKATKGNVINTVGCGDSMVAGFIAGCITSQNYDYALKLATACGGATAFSESLGSKQEIKKLMLQLH